jgi:putative transposase
VRPHWGAIAGADFFTTEVWTWRGLVTFYTLFVIDLASRLHIVGSTPHPDELFMRQVGRSLTAADDGVLVGHRVLICDRDRKWTSPVRQLLATSGIRIVQTPFQAPNANAYAERFVRSIKDECLRRVIPFGERHLRRALASSSSITTMSGITRVSATNSSTVYRRQCGCLWGSSSRAARRLLNDYYCAA